MAQTELRKGEERPVKKQKVGVALSWDHAGSHIDLDLQAIAFSDSGTLLDAVYYNNLKALKFLTHSGDEQSGEKKGYDEMVWLHLQKVPADVKLVAFVVACFKGGSIREARKPKIHLLEDALGQETGSYSLEQASCKAVLIASLFRQDQDSWVFRILDAPTERGTHFIDILEPTIGGHVRSLIPGAPRKLKAAFAMDKGSVVDLPMSNQMSQTKAGLGWDTDRGEVDLDVSAILLDGSNAEVDCCFFGRQEVPGVKHSGDNLTGHGHGDDETIEIDVVAIPPQVQQIFFVINIYTPGRSFACVSNPYCRLTSGDEEFCKFHLKEAGQEQALIMARMFREPGDSRWGFQALGIPCKGKTYKDSLPTVAQYAATKATDASLMRRQSTTVADEWGDGPEIEESTQAGVCGACAVQ